MYNIVYMYYILIFQRDRIASTLLSMNFSREILYYRCSFECVLRHFKLSVYGLC